MLHNINYAQFNRILDYENKIKKTPPPKQKQTKMTNRKATTGECHILIIP